MRELEPVLLAHLRARGGRVRFGTQLTGSRWSSALASAVGCPHRPSVLNTVEVAGAEGMFVPGSTDDR